ncbi:hypothetical protein [Streptomyces griseoaurantiacus]|uniref:hypothetical protein n=1 Tax=Streptomyces griseoaurantiacus TaxID=68213 RepID=UPI0036918849
MLKGVFIVKAIKIISSLVPAAVAVSLLAGCQTGGNEGDKPERLTAQSAADKLAEARGVDSLGKPEDNTGFCSAKDSDKGCEQLVTTNTVSIYEFATPKTAAHWVKTMTKQGDWRQVGRFALAWTARSQNLISDGERNKLEKAMKKVVASES